MDENDDSTEGSPRQGGTDPAIPAEPGAGPKTTDPSSSGFVSLKRRKRALRTGPKPEDGQRTKP